MSNETMPPPPSGAERESFCNYTLAELHAYARAYAEQRVAEEREACAQVLDQRRDNTAFADFEDAYREIANDIRARSKP